MKCRPDIRDMNLTDVNPSDVRNHASIKGSIAEKFVEGWLSFVEAIEFDLDFPRVVNGYALSLKRGGIIVKDKVSNEKKCNFDLAIFYHDRPYVVEVKSLKLNGFQKSIARTLDIASEIYQTSVDLLLFFPQYTNKIKDKEIIEQAFPSVICIDSGYKKAHLNKAVIRWEKDMIKLKRDKAKLSYI